MLIKRISIIGFFAAFLLSTSSFAQSTDTTMIVNGVCGMCQDKIEGAAKSLEGVSKVNWDVESKVLTLQYDASKTSLTDINKAINNVGYDTEFSTANEEAYQSLHGCCKYRDPEVVKDHE
jgi:mercuric ion binding protein